MVIFKVILVGEGVSWFSSYFEESFCVGIVRMIRVGLVLGIGLFLDCW